MSPLPVNLRSLLGLLCCPADNCKSATNQPDMPAGTGRPFLRRELTALLSPAQLQEVHSGLTTSTALT